jgi:hypothetical protein
MLIEARRKQPAETIIFCHRFTGTQVHRYMWDAIIVSGVTYFVRHLVETKLLGMLWCCVA